MKATEFLEAFHGYLSRAEREWLSEAGDDWLGNFDALAWWGFLRHWPEAWRAYEADRDAALEVLRITERAAWGVLRPAQRAAFEAYEATRHTNRGAMGVLQTSLNAAGAVCDVAMAAAGAVYWKDRRRARISALEMVIAATGDRPPPMRGERCKRI